MSEIEGILRAVISDKRMSLINGLYIVTDRIDYRSIDQVFPLFAEQQFFLDELLHDKIRGAEALEIGLGSGVLSIGAARAGAKRVTALEINPRAKNFAGFNIVLNSAADKVAILQGNEQVFLPVQGRRFDYILSNPPFEPTPPGMSYFYHSSAGPYGLDFLEKIFLGLDAHLTDDGHAQIVTAAPGDAERPTLLLDLAQKHLPGATRVVLNPCPISFEGVMDRLAEKKMGSTEQVDDLRQMARRDGITHLHLCVIHYDKGPKELRVEPSRRRYEDFWDAEAQEVTLS